MSLRFLNKKSFSALLLFSLLTACSEKSALLERGKKLYAEGEYTKAALVFKQAIELDNTDSEVRYQFAETLLKLGDLQNAANQYAAVLAEDPKNDVARLHLGQLLLAANQADNALKIASDILTRDANNIEAKLLFVGVLLANNNTDRAITELNALLNAQPENVKANLLSATIQIKTGKLDQAVATLIKTSEKNPTDASVLLSLAQVYIDTNTLDKAKSTLEAIIKIEPKKLEHRKRLMQFFVASKQLDEAEKVLRTTTEELTDDANAKILLVEFLYDKRTPEIAMAELLPFIDESPKNSALRFALVKLEIAQNHADKAEQALKEIIELDVKSPEALNAQTQLARLYVAMQRLEDAKTLNAQLLKDHPKDLDSLILRGEFSIAEGRLAEGISDFRNVLNVQPQNIAVLKLLSSAHLQNNDPVLAKENLQKILALSPNDESAAVDLANVLIKTGANEQAIQLIDAVVKEHPKSKLALQGAFSIYSAQKQWDKAQEFSKRIQSAFPEEGVGYYLSGLAYQSEGKTEASIHAFELALGKQPDAVEPMTQLVKGLISLKQSDKAVVTLTNSLKQQPKNFVFFNMLGSVYLNDKKYDDAISAFNKASIIKPEWSVPYHMIAVAYNAQQKKTDAIQALKLGVTNTKSNLELVNDLVALYSSQGEHDKAIAVYEDAYKLNPNSLDTLNNLVIYMTEFGKNKEVLSKAVKLADPLTKLDNPYSMDTLAWLAYKQGEYTKAEELLSKVLVSIPESVISNYHLGMVYFQQHNEVKAAEFLKKALDKKTDFMGIATAKQTLETLNSKSH